MSDVPIAEPDSRPRPHRHHVAILIFTLLVHGLLLLNDGVYYDGWLVRTFVEFGNEDRLRRWFFESGVPHVYYLHLWLGTVPGGGFVYKLLSFLCIAGSGLLTYSIAHESGFAGRVEALLIAIVALCYPAFQAAPELTILPFLICYFLFLSGAWLTLRAAMAQQSRRAGLTVAALACFFLSFTIPSLLVFYAGTLWFLLKAVLRRDSLEARPKLSQAALRHLHFLLLPPVFWVTKQHLLPAHGAYAEYNHFKLNAASLIYNFRTFLASSIYDQFTLALAPAPLVLRWVLLLLLAYAVYAALSRQPALGERIVAAAPRLCFGLALLLMGIVPYILVGKAPDAAGFGTRHALLVGLPMAILIVTVARLVFPGAEDSAYLSRPGQVVLMLIVVLFSGSLINSYIDWQMRWIKSRAVMQTLAQEPASAAYSTYWVNDRFATRQNDAWTFLEWSSMFKLIWKNESRAGMDVASPDLLRLSLQHPNMLQPPANSHFNLSDWNPKGRQADLTIERQAAAGSDLQVVSSYYRYRFIRRGEMTRFLQQVATVRVRPVASPRDVPLPGQVPP